MSMTQSPSGLANGNNGYASSVGNSQVAQNGGGGGAGVKKISLSDQELLSYVQEEFSKARTARMQFERSWYMNLAFYAGRQYAQWTTPYQTANGTYMKMFEPAAPPWRVRMITNKVRSIIRKEHANITRENPEPYVIPASSDDDDLFAARAAESLFDFLWRDLKGKRVMRRAAWWVCMTGTGFLKDWYDPTRLDSSGMAGSIRFEHRTPFHIYVPDLEEEELENQSMVHEVMAKSPDWVKQNFKRELQPDMTGTGSLEQKLLSALGIEKQSNYDHVAVMETWIKPCAKLPDGAVVTWEKDSILSATAGFPFGHGEYPYSKIEHIPTGRFYSESVITDLIPVQKEYNRTRSQIIEAKNRMAKPQWKAPRGSVNPRQMTTEPGLVIFYTPGFAAPEQTKMEPLPNYVIEELNRCVADMGDISFQHEVSKASAPPGVTAATAISYLQEQDDTSLANTVASIEEAVEKVGKHMLMHVQQFWVVQRTIRVIGDDGQYESLMLSQADIAGNTDLNIQSGSAMPRSRAAKQAFIMQLGQMGWIPPDRALRYLDMAETGKLYEELQIDARQAQRENLKMFQGIEQLVNTWDEHMVHIMEHNNERKKQKYENASDQIKQLFEAHVQMHQQAIAVNQAKAAQIQQAQQPPGALPAGPGGPGGPPHQGAVGTHPATQPVVMPPINPLNHGAPPGIQ